MTYGNGASVHYSYDAARRTTAIEHRNNLGITILKLEYEYDQRDLPTAIRESEGFVQSAEVKFTYDRRGRLIGETRTGVHAYDLSYVYDAGGNRRQKINWLEQRKTIYHYDIDEPNTYGSNNNRLAYYDEFDFSTRADVPVSTTWYYYNIAGNVKRVVTELASASGQYHGIRLGYAQNRQAVTYVIGETWTGDVCPQQNHEVQFIREFRYDSGRARYLNRELNPALFQAFGTYVPLNETWTDYSGFALTGGLGGQAYGDFAVDVQGGTPVVTDLRSFEPGLAMTKSWSAMGGESTNYLHSDALGTKRAVTAPSGLHNPAAASVYTAFGEVVRAPAVEHGGRYGYAGEWGYTAHTELPVLHLGARYYDPSTGRFLQRDPIGIRGGTNVYLYASARPTQQIDPLGLAGSSVNPVSLFGNGFTAKEVAEILGISLASALALQVKCTPQSPSPSSRPKDTKADRRPRIGDPKPTNPEPYPRHPRERLKHMPRIHPKPTPPDPALPPNGAGVSGIVPIVSGLLLMLVIRVRGRRTIAASARAILHRRVHRKGQS